MKTPQFQHSGLGHAAGGLHLFTDSGPLGRPVRPSCEGWTTASSSRALAADPVSATGLIRAVVVPARD
eukprot:10299654-Alexandrium_andersonii.AAC.1